MATLLAITLNATGPAPLAAAAAEQYPFAEKVDLAGAAWITETENSVTDLTVRVAHYAERSLWTGPVRYEDAGVVLFYVHRVRDPESGVITETNYEGFYGGPNASLSFQKSLRGATASFSIELWGYECVSTPGSGEPQGVQPTETTCEDLDSIWVDAAIAWEGLDEIFRDASNVKVSEPSLAMWGAHTVLASRGAVASGWIGNRTPGGIVLAEGTATVGILLRGKYHEHLVMPRQ